MMTFVSVIQDPVSTGLVELDGRTTAGEPDEGRS